MAKFAVDDKVAWDHTIAAQHAKGSILRIDALPPKTPVGTVKEIANPAETFFVVEFPDEHLEHPAVIEAAGTHEDAKCLTLTQDELVKVTDEPTPPPLPHVESEEEAAGLAALIDERDALKAEVARLKGGTE